MADLTDNQVLLRLVIKGMDPAEVQALADETYGQLKTDAAQHIDALTAAYKAASDAQARIAKDSADTRAQADSDAADEKIDAETKALDAVTKLMRQQEIEANKARGAWHGIMEDLENITTVARGAFDVMAGGFDRLKELGESIATTTNIYGALKGSIDEMRESTEGEVADIDLIEAKNRGFQESLHLTDQQYGAVAAAAHDFAKVLGVDTKEALDKLVTGLATGRVRTLEMVGVTVNADDANKAYAESIGKTVDALTDHDKKNAILQESLRAIDRKVVETGGTYKTFAQDYEQTMATIKNVTSDALVSMGHLVVSFMEHWERIPDNFRIIIAKIKDLFPGQSGNADAAMADAIADQSARELASVNAAKAAADAAKARLADPTGAAYKDATTDFGTNAVSGPKKKDDHGKLFDDTINKFGKSQGSAYGAQNPDDDLESKAGLASQAGDNGTQTLDEYTKALDAANDAAEKNFVTLEKGKGVTVDLAAAYGKMAASLGLTADALDHDEKMQALQNEAMVQADKLAVEAKKKADERRKEIKATKDKAGFMGVFLWGTDGPDQTYKEMDAFQQKLVDTMGGVSSTLTGEAEKMSGAIGKSLGASISGAAGAKVALQQQAHDALVALSEQAAGKAVWEGAEALASLAVGNFPGAALHGAAAAAYGAVAVAAGVGARAVGTPSAPTQQQQWTDQYNTAQQKKAFDSTLSGGTGSSGLSSSSSGGSFTGSSASSSSSTTTNTSNAPVTINMSVMPGGEADAGRAVMRALQALQSQTGVSVQPLIASG